MPNRIKKPAVEWPAEKISLRPISVLKVNPHNARKHSQEEIESIAALMLDRGWTTAILVDENDLIIAGHKRVSAAQLLVKRGHERFELVPVMSAKGWSEAEKRAYLIADNQHALRASWDDEKLSMELGDLAAMDFDLSLTGFGDDDLNRLIGDREEAGPAIRRIPTDEVSDRFWIVVRGPLRSQAKALQALRKVMAEIDGVEVDMGTITDGV